MVTARQLLKGTQKVNPKALERAPDGSNSPFIVFEVQKIKSLNSLVVCTQQKKSGRWPKGERLTSREGVYKQVMRFSLESGSEVNKNKPRVAKDKCSINCGCDNYYYMWWWGNRKVKAHEGMSYPAYKPKGSGDAGSVINPSNVPGMCKHLVFVLQELKRKRLIQ